MSKANLKRWAFNLFLKSVTSETVRKSAGRESGMDVEVHTVTRETFAQQLPGWSTVAEKQNSIGNRKK